MPPKKFPKVSLAAKPITIPAIPAEARSGVRLMPQIPHYCQSAQYRHERDAYVLSQQK